MARAVEILVGVNAALGIAAFVIARGLWKRGREKGKEMLGIYDEEEHERRT